MKIVTDRGSDFSSDQIKDLEIHFAPMRLELDGETYLSGEDIQADEFYSLLSRSPNFPSTSQATAGDFARIYRELAKEDPDILSMHISSGLSGTINSARAGAALVPEARVTIVDTHTLSCPEAWQVETAALANKANYALKEILSLIDRIGLKTQGFFTIDTLKYLIHGGRISHLKGLMASLLDIKPVIGVDRETGKYVSRAQERTMKRAIRHIVDIAAQTIPEGTKVRVQLLHGNNLPALIILKERLVDTFDCVFMETAVVGPILGAHTGPDLVGLCIAPMSVFEQFTP